MASSPPQSAEKVHFFDIATGLEGYKRSTMLNPLKTKLILNYKRIPYTQSFVSSRDLGRLYMQHSVPPIPGARPYLLPLIKHSSVPTLNHFMNESFDIALHLERTFLSHGPSIFPTAASLPLALAVQHLIDLATAAVWQLIIVKLPDVLPAEDAEAMRQIWIKRRHGKPFETMASKDPERDWKTLEGHLTPLLAMLASTAKSGPYFEGGVLSYSDFICAGYLTWVVRVDEDGVGKRLLDLGGGEFSRLLQACQPLLEMEGEDLDWPIERGKSKAKL